MNQWGKRLATEQDLKPFAERISNAIRARDFRDDWNPFQVQDACAEIVWEELRDLLDELYSPAKTCSCRNFAPWPADVDCPVHGEHAHPGRPRGDLVALTRWRSDRRGREGTMGEPNV